MIDTVLILNDHASVNGGQARVAIETALGLRERGLRVIYYYGAGGIDSRLMEAGVEVSGAGGYDILSDPDRMRAATGGIWNVRAAQHLRRVLEGLDSSRAIVHTHGWAKALSPSIGPIVTSGRVPHVYTAHEFFLACPNGGFFDYRKNEICRRRPLGVACLCTNCDSRALTHKAWRMARQATLWSVGAMPRRLRDVIYLTNTQLMVLRPHLSPSVRWHHLPNVVERSNHERVVAEDNDMFLFMGRLSPEKGGEIVAKAALQANVKIAFAGDGDSRDRILAANPNALMLGWLTQEELRVQMRRSRCVVFPSLWTETQGLAVLEALEMGLPPLVADQTAAAEFVRDGVDGLHVRAGDVEAWTQAMKRLQNSELVAACSKACYEAGCSLGDAAGYMERLLAIYHSSAALQRSELGASKSPTGGKAAAGNDTHLGQH